MHRSLLIGLLIVGLHANADAPRAINLPAGELVAALDVLSKYSNIELVYRRDQLQGMRTKGVSGTLSTQDAVRKLLEGTALRLSTDPRTGAMLISQADDAQAGSVLHLVRSETTAAQDPPAAKSAAAAQAGGESTKGIPEILVKGSKMLNSDIKRTRDDPQPYVVFDRGDIERSQAANLEGFLKTRLPMNASSFDNAQTTGNAVATSNVNLRGLGSNQTLILVDGRRMPGITTNGQPQQPDISGISLSAVERIEVLPSTAGGIYGGSATGGVINIVLRRDFRGLETRANYTNTFDADAGSLRLDVNGGFSLEGGRTQVMVTATRSTANNLTVGDRDFAARSRALQLANNPASIIGSGAPPLGATVNIRAASGNLVLDDIYGGTNLGSNITHIPLGYRGPASDNGAALVANAGSYNLDLPDDLNANKRGLIAVPSMMSVAANLRREFGAGVEAFLDFSRLKGEGTSQVAGLPNLVISLPAGAPNNPFKQNIRVRFPVPGLSFGTGSESITTRASGGLILRLPHRWIAELDFGWNRSRFAASSVLSVVDSAGAAALGNGQPGSNGRPALNVLQEGNTFPIDFSAYALPTPNAFSGPYDTDMKDATARLSGPVMELPGGLLNFSVLIERREEEQRDAISNFVDTESREKLYLFVPRRFQDVDSYYLEARAPLISAANAGALARELELQVSMRHDRYTTRSDGSSSYQIDTPDGPFPDLTYMTNRVGSTDYTFGLRFMPIEDLTLRASLGTGFLPPSITQIVLDGFTGEVLLGADPKRGNTNTNAGLPVTWTFGGNPGLQPEESRSRSVGLILTPRFAPQLRVSVDYTRIEKTNEIFAPPPQFLLDREDDFPGRIVRGENVEGDQPGWAGPIVSFNQTLLNVARTDLEAYDLQADYVLPTQSLGEFHWYVLATWQPKLKNQVLPTTAAIDRVGFSDGTLEWRGNIGLTWDRGPVTLGWNAQYYDAYRVYSSTSSASAAIAAALNQGSAIIPDQIYHDLIATYRFERSSRWASGLLANGEISLGIQNLFDTSPPILASNNPSSPGYSTYGDPRLRRYSISLRKNF